MFGRVRAGCRTRLRSPSGSRGGEDAGQIRRGRLVADHAHPAGEACVGELIEPLALSGATVSPRLRQFVLGAPGVRAGGGAGRLSVPFPTRWRHLR